MVMAKYASIPLLMCLLVLGFIASPLQAHEEMASGKYVSLVDENNNVIHQTGIKVYPGDEYITADNARYKVVEVVGDTARCIYQGQEIMPSIEYDSQKKAWIFEEQQLAVVGQNKPTVAVYHTHSDESYVPSDGTESKEGNGGIYDVGEALVQRLQQVGFNVEYNKNNHNPHDINAYNRSRRTAASLLKKNPDVILDVHRDAVPASQYQTEVEGEMATKVKLVVGRTNPNMKTNLEFAKKMKAVMDKVEPGLSNGIFMGKGDYNQDLSPRAMLIEVGAHTNKKEDAEQGVAFFADTLASVMGVSTAQGAGAQPDKKPLQQDNQGAGTAILIVLTVVAATAGGYYLLNRRSGVNK